MEDNDIKVWIKKVEELKKGEVDLSRDEDLSIGLMHLISLEEHFYFTAMKTNDKKYLDMLNSVRELRKATMKKIVRDPKGEEWCISKHLLGGSMRLFEVGTKELSKGHAEESHAFFQAAFNLFSLFFAINLKVVGAQELKQDTANGHEAGLMNTFSRIMKKIVDCCKE